MKKLLGIGECMVELSSAGEEGLMRLSFAGDVLNTLWYAQSDFAQSNKNWNAGFLSAVGEDPMS
ncbi:MAG: sugar kinase, partial [Pseudomonadota bacterium]